MGRKRTHLDHDRNDTLGTLEVDISRDGTASPVRWNRNRSLEVLESHCHELAALGEAAIAFGALLACSLGEPLLISSRLRGVRRRRCRWVVGWRLRRVYVLSLVEGYRRCRECADHSEGKRGAKRERERATMMQCTSIRCAFDWPRPCCVRIQRELRVRREVIMASIEPRHPSATLTPRACCRIRKLCPRPIIKRLSSTPIILPRAPGHEARVFSACLTGGRALK